jgi:hypothetical protein
VGTPRRLEKALASKETKGPQHFVLFVYAAMLVSAGSHAESIFLEP